MHIGAVYRGNKVCNFSVWGPMLENVYLELPLLKTSFPMHAGDNGYWLLSRDDIAPGQLYWYVSGDKRLPDPASFYQPAGVHGPSAVVDHGAFSWTDNDYKPCALKDLIIYEIHVGTFTPAGTFDAVIERLEALKDLGITAVELMPVGQFPGVRNWGYDGAFPFAVQNSYGGPDGLKNLVNAAHRLNLAVLLDVVYNHFGPEGAYAGSFGKYYTDRYCTPWGKAVNFDDEYSDEVRNFFIENALYWLRHFHIDGLRLDAVHAIYDFSAHPFLQELSERVEEFSREQGRKFYLIAESDLNDVRLIKPRNEGGFALDAQWCDDFHHALHALITGERQGYYAGFGDIEQLAKSIREGFVYNGQYSPTRKRRFGSSSADIDPSKLIAFVQNHDQIGNRLLGQRLTEIVSFETLKLVSGICLLSPYIPLLFMGEEYGETSPFLYFIDHSDFQLKNAVRQGRKAEFKAFSWLGEPPDPADEKTFLASKLHWRERENSKVLLMYYKQLIALRKAFGAVDKKSINVQVENGIIKVKRASVLLLMNLKQDYATIRTVDTRQCSKVLDSSDTCWNGPGAGGEGVLSPMSIVVYDHG